MPAVDNLVPQKIRWSDVNNSSDRQLYEEKYAGDDNSSFYLVDELSIDDTSLDNKKIVFYQASSSYSIPDIPFEAKINYNKNKVLRILLNEDITVGYTSMTERFLNDLLIEEPLLLKEVLMHVYKEVFTEKEVLQNFIEVMSNLDYKSLYPTNTIIAVGMINHKDIGVQEAAIASFEKWDDKKNIGMLRNISYTTEWIESYANEVIEYLESC